jgi:hypothetical protein
MPANENERSADETPKSDPTGNPSDETPKPDVTPKPRRRDILAGMAFGLAGVPGAPDDRSPAVAEARRLIAVWRKVRDAERDRCCEDQPEEFDSHLRERAATRAAGLAIRRTLGLHGLHEPTVVAVLDGAVFVVTGDASESQLTTFDLKDASGAPVKFRRMMPTVSDLEIEEIPLAMVVRL